MQMKIAVTWPNEPRISLGDISLKYMGRALNEMPTKEEQNTYIKSKHIYYARYATNLYWKEPEW